MFLCQKLNKNVKTNGKNISNIYDRVSIFTYEDLLQSNYKTGNLSQENKVGIQKKKLENIL